MARGGRSGHGGHNSNFGRGHHIGSSFGRNNHSSFGSSFGHSHHTHRPLSFSSSSTRSATGMGGIFSEFSIDTMARNMMPPTLINGIYTFAGSQMSFKTHSTLDPPQNPLQVLAQSGALMQNIMMQQNMQMQQNINMVMPANQNFVETNSIMPTMADQGMMGMISQNPPVSPPMQQADITIVGNKTKPGNQGCIFSTIMAGMCCCFPLCFMCCMWWKKIVAAMYELTPEAYRDIGVFLDRNQTVTNLNLTVADNSFNAEKARILYDSLSRSRVTGFTFVNIALACNNRGNEADDFRANVVPFKSINMATSLKWGDMMA